MSPDTLESAKTVDSQLTVLSEEVGFVGPCRNAENRFANVKHARIFDDAMAR